MNRHWIVFIQQKWKYTHAHTRDSIECESPRIMDSQTPHTSFVLAHIHTCFLAFGVSRCARRLNQNAINKVILSRYSVICAPCHKLQFLLLFSHVHHTKHTHTERENISFVERDEVSNDLRAKGKGLESEWSLSHSLPFKQKENVICSFFGESSAHEITHWTIYD